MNHASTFGLHRSFWGLLLILALPLLSFSPLPTPSDWVGHWHDEEGGGVIRVYQEDVKIFGELISADDPKDQQKIEGKHILILEDFEEEESGNLCCGTIYLVRFNLHVDGTLSMVDDSTLLLKGKMGPFSRSRIWKRM